MIKEGGVLDIYYVASSELEDNVQEGSRYEVADGGGEGKLANYTSTSKQKLIPSISEIIDINKKDFKYQLKVNIYVFTCETFFIHYLTSDNVFLHILI